MQLDKRWTVLGSCEGNTTRSCWLKPLLPVRTMIYKCWVENHTEYVSLLMLGISRDMNNILTCTFIYCYILLLTIYVNILLITIYPEILTIYYCYYHLLLPLAGYNQLFTGGSIRLRSIVLCERCRGSSPRYKVSPWGRNGTFGINEDG